MSSPNLAKIVRALVNNPDRDPLQIIRGMGGENLSREQLATVFEMSVAEFLAQAGKNGNARRRMSHESGRRKRRRAKTPRRDEQPNKQGF